MSETEAELWGVVDRVVYGTNDPDEIKQRFKRAFEQRQTEESTLGGFLRCLRTDEYLKTKEMALKAGVEQSLWQAWEANRTIPSQADLSKICTNLELGDHTIEKLSELRQQMPKTILSRLSRYEPDQLVARGAGVVESELEWEKLHPSVQTRLSLWAKKQNLKFPEDFLPTLFALETEEEQERWVAEVLGVAHDE